MLIFDSLRTFESSEAAERMSLLISLEDTHLVKTLHITEISFTECFRKTYTNNTRVSSLRT